MEKQRVIVLMIGNSHIDPVWLWRDREGLQEVKATFSSALDRMDEFLEFEFTGSSAAFYDWLEKHCPGFFARIAQRVKEGRWHLTGGWWVEPDVNIPGGESLVRQGLYGQRYFLKAFGKMAETAYLPDSFGHSCGLPKILRGQRLCGYVFMRPQPWEIDLPAPAFVWRDEDNSRVTAYQIQGEYCAWTRTAILDNLQKSLKSAADHNMAAVPVFYGVGNHGGGPTIENIKAIRELKEEYPDLNIQNGSLESFFEQASGMELPEFEGELEGCFPGCFTADSEIKRLNRLAEEMLTKAETLCALAIQFGCEYPTKALYDAWKLLLFQQFHDTLAGTARKEARDDACDDMRRCLSVGREVLGGALQALSAAIDTRGDGYPLLLVNSCDEPYEGVVDADIYWRTKHPLRLKDAAGHEVAYDFSSRDLVSPDSRKHLVFRAMIPAMGYAVYRLLPESAQISMERMDCGDTFLENSFLRLELDEKTGCLKSLYCKRTGTELLSGPVSLTVYEDKRDTWGAKGDIGPLLYEYRLNEMFVLEAGNVRSSILVRFVKGNSEAACIWSLGRDDPFVTLDAKLESREKHVLTALRFPFGDLFSTVMAEGAYGEQKRSFLAPGEKNCRRYCDLQGDNASLLILNNAKYGYRESGGAYEVLLSRSPIHAFGSGETPQKGREYAYCDQGEVPFSLRLWPHGDEMGRLQRVRAAQSFHRPVDVLPDNAHEGALALRQSSFLTRDELDSVMIHLVKQGEDGGLALRLQNMSDHDSEGSHVYAGKRYPVTVGARRLMTAVLKPDGGCAMADLLELAETEMKNSKKD